MKNTTDSTTTMTDFLGILNVFNLSLPEYIFVVLYIGYLPAIIVYVQYLFLWSIKDIRDDTWEEHTWKVKVATYIDPDNPDEKLLYLFLIPVIVHGLVYILIPIIYWLLYLLFNLSILAFTESTIITACIVSVLIAVAIPLLIRLCRIPSIRREKLMERLGQDKKNFNK